MRPVRKNVNRNSLLWVLPLTVSLLISLLSSPAGAVDYYVWGRVYSASALTEGEEAPINPLTGVPNERIIGDDMFAVTPRNLVKVRVIKADDGSELGSHIVSDDGGYFVPFNAPSGGASVRFIVEELATSNVLLDSDPNELSQWTTPADENNIRFLLVREGVAEIGDDREFAPAPPSPATRTAIFTRVGKIEVETEVEGTTYHLIDTSTGLVTVPEVVSTDLHIPEYQDAPFGGNLYMFGAFSRDLYSPPSPLDRYYYRVKFENVADASDTGYIDDPLVKTKYTVDFLTGAVDTERVTLGPLPESEADGYSGCYKLTPIAASNNVFWSFPDLVALWRTGQINGKYRITLEAVDLSGPEVPPTPPPEPTGWDDVDYTHIILLLDNVRPEAKILPLGPGDELHPTPRVYVPDPPDTTIGCDLTFPRLGSWSVDYGGTADPICSILDLQGDVGSRYLAFKLTAHHDNGDGVGYLRYWHFGYRRNDKNYQIHIGKVFDGASMADYSTAQFNSTESDTKGFEDKFLYLDKSYLEPGIGTSLGGCGYRFVIRAATRTTDGYHYLRWAWDDDIHYVQR